MQRSGREKCRRRGAARLVRSTYNVCDGTAVGCAAEPIYLCDLYHRRRVRQRQFGNDPPVSRLATHGVGMPTPTAPANGRTAANGRTKSSNGKKKVSPPP